MRGSLALLFLLALPAAAQDASSPPDAAAPGPSSGNCGFSGLFGLNDLHAQLEAIYEDVFILSGVAGRRPAVVYLQTPGTKIAALRRAGGRADSAEFEVVVYQRLCDIAHSSDEVAFVFAHEIGHLAKGHIPQLETAYAGATVDCAQSGGDCARDRLKPLQQKFEAEADDYAADVLSKPGSRYKAIAGVDAMEHFQDLRAALGADTAHDATHGSPADRADAIRSRLAATAGRNP